jgi:plasmid stability protein
MERGIGVEVMAECSQIAGMATLTIRNLPDDLHAALKKRAQMNRRSLNQEVIAELSVATGRSRAEEARQRWEGANALVDEMRKGMKGFMSAQEIDAAIQEGRM